MQITIAPNSFKGSLDATQVCDAIAEGLLKALPDVQIHKQPIADGGEMTTQIMVNALGGTIKETTVKDPLGREITAKYGVLKDKKTGVMELASASGISLLTKDELNPMRTSTYGTGQLIEKLLEEGCRKLIIGLGGSATVDGGTGMMRALGIRFTERNKSAIPLGGGYLHTIEKIDLTELDPRLHDCEINVMCDVENTLLGDEGAAMMFSPQKGATSEQAKLLEANLVHFAKVTQSTLGVDIAALKHGGAAGGTAAALAGYLDAKLVYGIDYLLKTVGLEEKIKTSDLTITAEGRLDEQTLKGKGPLGVAQLSHKHQVPVACITGQIADGVSNEQFPDFDILMPITTRPMSLKDSMDKAYQLISFRAQQLGNMIKVMKR